MELGVGRELINGVLSHYTSIFGVQYSLFDIYENEQHPPYPQR